MPDLAAPPNPTPIPKRTLLAIVNERFSQVPAWVVWDVQTRRPGAKELEHHRFHLIPGTPVEKRPDGSEIRLARCRLCGDRFHFPGPRGTGLVPRGGWGLVQITERGKMSTDLRQGDCLKLLPTLATDSVDLIFSDPPYGTTDLKMDDGVVDFDWGALHADLKRVLKPNGWFFCFFPARFVCNLLAFWRHKFEYVCIKPRATPSTHNTVRPLYAHEILWALVQPDLRRPTDLYYDKAQLQFGEAYTRRRVVRRASEFGRASRVEWGDRYTKTDRRQPTTVLRMEPKNIMPRTQRTPHPTQKPLDLARTIVKAYCPPGGTVLDPFAGSGTHVLAAATQGRNAIGFELDPEYYRIARGRLDGRLDAVA